MKPHYLVIVAASMAMLLQSSMMSASAQADNQGGEVVAPRATSVTPPQDRRPLPPPQPDRAKSSGASPMIVALDRGIDQGYGLVDEQSLSFSEMKIDVLAHGLTADVTMEVRIANHTDRQMEGRFSLALPQDAVVTGYALDIEGRMIDGVLMDQPKAKAVYQEQVRGRIDPGLAEVTSGNKFSTSVYPVMPRSSRTIRVNFSAPMDRVEGLKLALKTAASVGDFALSGKWGDGSKADLYFGAADSRNEKLSEVALNGSVNLKPKTANDNMLASRHSNGRTYFQLSGKSEQSPVIRSGDAVRIYWDKSLSRRDDLLAEEIALASRLVESTRPRSIELVTFSAGNNASHQVAGSSDLAAKLQAVTYRGGTSLRGLDKASTSKADSCLLFSDGEMTIDVASNFAPGCRLVVISSAEDANRSRLGRIAREAGGNLVTLTKDNGAAAASMILQGKGLAPIIRDSSDRPIAARTFTSGDGGWLAIGPMPQDGTVNADGRNFRAATANASNAAGALWAAERVAALADNPLDREEMKELALAHSVASPTMAFLVLESPQQYVDADIKPPAGYSSQWMKEYDEVLANHQTQTIAAKEERMAFVLNQWAQRKQWWGKTFDGKYQKPERESYNSDDSCDTCIVSSAPVPEVVPPPPPPVAAPAPAAEMAAASADASVEAVVVTGATVDSRGGTAETKTDIQNTLSDRPYLTALDKASTDNRFVTLAEQEREHGTVPAFYFDTAEWFRLKGDKETSLQLLQSAVELPMADDETRQIIAFRLQRDGDLDSAIALLERIAVTSDYRPQPKRQLALALAERGKRLGAAGRVDLERAFQLLTEVALEPANNRYDGMEVIALMEANALIPHIEKAGGKWSLDQRLTGMLDTDARIVIEWTSDAADLDLHVIEPSTEEVYYSHPLSAAGGLLSNDMTQGYGPEEYAIRRARNGQYKVTVHGYSPDRLNPNGKGRVMVRLIHNFARANQREELIDTDIDFDRSSGGNNKHLATMTVGGSK